MKSARIGWSVFCLSLMCLTSRIQAEEGWTLGKLNPFHKKSDVRRASANIADEPQDKLSLSRLELPKVNHRSKSPAPSSRKPSQPSTLAKLGASSKQVLNKTKQVLTPWNWGSDKKPRPATASAARKSKNSKSKPFYAAWFDQGNEKQKDRKIETVNEFLAQPRPSI